MLTGASGLVFLGHHLLGVTIVMFGIKVETVEFSCKMVQLSDGALIIAVIGYAMIQSQWLRQSLAFWKFALLSSLFIMNQVMHLTAAYATSFVYCSTSLLQ